MIDILRLTTPVCVTDAGFIKCSDSPGVGTNRQTPLLPHFFFHFEDTDFIDLVEKSNMHIEANRPRVVAIHGTATPGTRRSSDSWHDIMIDLKNRLPASLGDVDNPDEDNLFLGDAATADSPVRKLTHNPLKFLPRPSVTNYDDVDILGRTHIEESAHRTGDTPCKFLEGNRIVRRRLVLRHDLGMPVAIAGPLKSGRI